MRIAEHFMNINTNLNNKEFFVGNIGPDCGVPNEDWSQITYITGYYLRGIKEENPNRDFPFLTKDEMNDFVDTTIHFLNDSCSTLLS